MGISVLEVFSFKFKITFFFFIAPVVLIIGAGYIYLRQLDNLPGSITIEISRPMEFYAQRAIAEKSKSVASQVRLYLLGFRGLVNTQFNFNRSFKKVAVQEVGNDGFTFLYEIPPRNGVWRTWAHVDPGFVGVDMKDLRETFGKGFQAFEKIYTAVKNGKPSEGSYTYEGDGAFEQKYMACTPVSGTPFAICATANPSNWMKEIGQLKTNASEIAKRTKFFVYLMTSGTVIIFGIIFFLYGFRFFARIKSLAVAAERISLGKVDTKINVKSRDEIGDLAEAIRRMQASIRLALEKFGHRQKYRS